MVLRKGQYVLRTIEEDDVDIIFEWRNANHVRKYMFSNQVISREEHLAWFHNISKDPLRQCLIFENNWKKLGAINVTQDHDHTLSCKWGLYLGEKNRPKKSGLKMGFMALNFIFGNLKYEKIHAEILSVNEPSIRFHKKLNFEIDDYTKNNKRDVINMTLLNKDWLKIKGFYEKTLHFEGENHE